MHNHSVDLYKKFSFAVSVRQSATMNPCGEVIVDPGAPCNLSDVRVVGEPIGFHVGEWTALDDILYALKEDDLAAIHGPKKAKEMVRQEIAARRSAADLFNWFNSHTHTVTPTKGGFIPTKGGLTIGRVK
jgi:hypothetical protein